MTREMQDGINSDAAGMDHSIALVAYYIDGPFAWTAEEIALFPHSVHVRIATRWTTRDGNVIDRENGDATPEQAAAWAHQRRTDGYPWPTVYCSESNQAAVIAAFNTIGEPMPLWWLAHYDNLDVLPTGPGVVAKQYADPGPLDKSIVADHWAGVDQGGMVTDFTSPGDPRTPDNKTWAATFGQPISYGAELDATLEALLLGSQQGPTWPAGPGVLQRLEDLKNAVAGIPAAVAAAVQPEITAEQTALLAAIKTLPAPIVQQITADPNAVAQQLIAAGLPGDLVGALLAVLQKAAPPATPPATS